MTCSNGGDRFEICAFIGRYLWSLLDIICLSRVFLCVRSGLKLASVVHYLHIPPVPVCSICTQIGLCRTLFAYLMRSCVFAIAPNRHFSNIILSNVFYSPKLALVRHFLIQWVQYVLVSVYLSGICYSLGSTFAGCLLYLLIGTGMPYYSYPKSLNRHLNDMLYLKLAQLLLGWC